MTGCVCVGGGLGPHLAGSWETGSLASAGLDGSQRFAFQTLPTRSPVALILWSHRLGGGTRCAHAVPMETRALFPLSSPNPFWRFVLKRGRGGLRRPPARNRQGTECRVAKVSAGSWCTPGLVYFRRRILPPPGGSPTSSASGGPRPPPRTLRILRLWVQAAPATSRHPWRPPGKNHPVRWEGAPIGALGVTSTSPDNPVGRMLQSMRIPS